VDVCGVCSFLCLGGFVIQSFVELNGSDSGIFSDIYCVFIIDF